MGRPPSVVVQPAEVLEVWGQWLEKRRPGFAWDGSDYQRPSRNQSVDKESLEKYKGPLARLLQLAPSGFPTHSSLRDAFVLADETHDIFDSKIL
eukprot:1870046-Alexandrium_andersonii.AAC.1